MAGRCNCLHAVSDLPHANNCPAWEPDTGPSLRDALYPPKRARLDIAALRERLDAATKGPDLGGFDKPSLAAWAAHEANVADLLASLRTLLDVYEAAGQVVELYQDDMDGSRALRRLRDALKEGQGR